MKRTRLNLAPWFFLAPFLALFGLFTVWPLAHSLLLALQQTYGPGTTRWGRAAQFQYTC